MSVFGKERIYIFHKYSLYARGNDKLLGTYLPLAMTPLGGQDSINGGLGLPYHDQYNWKDITQTVLPEVWIAQSARQFTFQYNPLGSCRKKRGIFHLLKLPDPLQCSLLLFSKVIFPVSNCIDSDSASKHPIYRHVYRLTMIFSFMASSRLNTMCSPQKLVNNVCSSLEGEMMRYPHLLREAIKFVHV